MSQRTCSPELKERLLSLMQEGRSVSELARQFEPSRRTLRSWKRRIWSPLAVWRRMSPMRRRSSCWNARIRFPGRIKPSWKRPWPGLPPIGTVVAGAAEGLSIHASAPMQNQADPRKNLYGDRDVPSVSNQPAKLLRVAHAMCSSKNFTAISANPNPGDSRREWGGAYGSRRIAAQLRAEGCSMNRKRVQRVMRELNIRGRQVRCKVDTTRSGRRGPFTIPFLTR